MSRNGVGSPSFGQSTFHLPLQARQRARITSCSINTQPPEATGLLPVREVVWAHPSNLLVA
jgi:hypothetical protein